MRIALRVLDERARSHLPAYATAGAAGLDLRACIDAPIMLMPGQTPRRYWGQVKFFRNESSRRGPLRIRRILIIHSSD